MCTDQSENWGGASCINDKTLLCHLLPPNPLLLYWRKAGVLLPVVVGDRVRPREWTRHWQIEHTHMHKEQNINNETYKTFPIIKDKLQRTAGVGRGNLTLI